MHHNPVRRLRGLPYALTAGVSIVLSIGLAAWALAGCSSTPSAKAAPAVTTAVPAPTTTTPKPHGPYAIGIRTLTFVDTTRPTPANGSEPARPNRTLETTIEYPTVGKADINHVHKGAASAPGPFPVLVYAHGFGGGYESPYLRYWAQAGFVAVAPTFPLTRHDAPGGLTFADTVNEPADVSFVLSQMMHLPASQSDLQRIIDTARVGLMGASLGATVAMDVGYNTRYQDPRFKAVVAVAGGCGTCQHGITDPGGTFYTGPSTPLLLVHGTIDPFAPYRDSVQEYAKAPAPKFFVTLIGAGHIAFDQPWETIAARSMIDFFRRYLENDRGALGKLKIDANVAGKARLQAAPG